MKKVSRRWECPVCRALNCRFNKNDTCNRNKASEIPGYRCPYFEIRETNKEINIRNVFATKH